MATGTLIGYQESFNIGDRILSLGAVTSILPNFPASTFQVAIYTDVNSAPGTLLAATTDITPVGTDDGCTNNGSVAKDLSQPLTINAQGDYWLMILVTSGPVGVVSNNISAAYLSECGSQFSAWPNAPSLLKGYKCLPEGDKNSGVVPRIFAIIDPV